MKNKIRTLLIASMCMAMATTAIPTSFNPLATTTVEASTEKNGLYHEGSNWNYYTDNAINKSSTLVKYNGSWWYVHDGEVDFSARTVVKFNGAWWFVENGKVDFSANTVARLNNSWWYVKNGKVDFNYTGLCKYNGSWWYIRNGKIDFGARTLCKYNGIWWYVNGGRVDFNATTVVRYGSTWYYVKGGQVHWNDTGLCKYNGNWWYIDNGRINFSDRTLVKYNGTWWFVENGKVNFNSGKTLCKYNGTWWYVRNGQICWKNVAIAGDDFVKYGSYRYPCKNGQVDWDASYAIEKVDASIWQYDTNHVIDSNTFADGSTIYANDGWDAEAGNKDCANYLLACGHWTKEYYDQYYGYKGKFPPVIGYTNQGKPYYYDPSEDWYYFNENHTWPDGHVGQIKIYFDKNGNSLDSTYEGYNFLK